MGNGTEFAVNVDRIDTVIPRHDGLGAVIGLVGDSDSAVTVREPYADIISTLYALGVHAWRIRPAVPPPAVTLSVDDPEEAAP